MATQLAKEAGTKEQHTAAKLVPIYYHKFLSQFDKKLAERFPISRSCDHEILTDDSFVPSDCRPFPMNPTQEKALNEFLEENLRKGYIHPSKSPQASPFFFVDKKDATYRGVQDYRKLNELTISNCQPFPRIEDLMEKLRGAKYFTKLDLRLGYNNIRIKDGHQWKAAFKTPRRLF